MIGLVFLGTFYYLEAGWRTFDYFQSEMESLTLNYSKIIIAYFSSSLLLALMQLPFFYNWLSTVGLVIIVSGVFLTTKSLNSQLDRFSNLSQDISNIWNKWLNWAWFSIVFIVPLLALQNWSVGIPTINGLTVDEEVFGWIIFGSLTFGYWNLIIFLLTPFQMHKIERDKSAKENKKRSRQGKSSANETWDQDRINLAENRLKSELDESGLSISPDLDIIESHAENEELSGDLSEPYLYAPPSVDKNGEASVFVYLPDDWESDRDLLDQSSYLAQITGILVRSAYRDLTGIQVRVFRRRMDPWKDYSTNQMLLKIRWTGTNLSDLDTVQSDSKEILKSASNYLLDPTLYPLGLKDHNFDLTEKEPEEDEQYSLYTVSDKSHAMAKRYSSKVVIQEGLSKDQMKELIPDIIENISKKDVYRNESTEDHWKGKKSRCCLDPSF